MTDPRPEFRVGTSAEVAAYFARVANAIKMTNDQKANKSKIVVYEPIALLWVGCVMFVLFWFYY